MRTRVRSAPRSRTSAASPSWPAPTPENLDPVTDAPSFELAARVELEPKLKQGLLESRSEGERLRRVARLLEGAAQALEARAERARIASMNGHVKLRP